MEKKFKDKNSRPSRFGKRNEGGDKSFDKKGAFDKKKSFDKNEKAPFRKPSGIRTKQDDKFDVEKFTGAKPRTGGFKGGFKRNYNKSESGTEGNNDHYYGKPFENKENPKKREGSFDKPYRKRIGSEGFKSDEKKPFEKKPFQKREGSFSKSYDKPLEKKPYEKREGSFDKPYRKHIGSEGFKSDEKKPFEKKPFQKREGSFSKSYDKPLEKKPYEKREESFDKPYRKRIEGEGFKSDEKKPFEKKPFQKREGSFSKSYDKPLEKKEFKPRYEDVEGKLDFEDFSYSEDANRNPKNKFAREGHIAVVKAKKKTEDDTVAQFKERKKRARNSNITTPNYNFDKFKSAEEQMKERNKRLMLRGKQKSEETAKSEVDKEENEVRLNRFIANSGVCSRREADVLIQEGRVKINSEVMTEMGYRVKPTDSVYLDDEPLKRERIVYVLLNKPKDHITTTDDPEGRKTVMNLVRKACNERIYPVGRLDRNTTGLLLMTNDGALAEKLAHPSNNIKKIYQILLAKPMTEEDFDKIAGGMELEDGEIKVDKISIISDDSTALEVHIHSGKNRIVRRIFEHLDYEVLRLDRVAYAGLSKKGLERGEWRYLTEQEVIRLKYFVR
jgi:23S rRNA pseudouridine2605 synthase